MASSRRNALTFLGLAGIAAPAMATEDLALNQKHGKFPSLGKLHVKRTAAALRRLADGLESGAVIPEGLSISSELGDAPVGANSMKMVSVQELQALARRAERFANVEGRAAITGHLLGELQRLVNQAGNDQWLCQDLRFRFYLTEEGHEDPFEQTDPMA